MLTSIILNQYPNIIYSQEAQIERAGPLTFSKKLFIGTHTLDIELSRHQRHAAGEKYFPLYKATRKDMMLKLEKITKDLQVSIVFSTLRKKKVNDLLNKLTKK